MAIEMKSISNYDYLRYTTTASREISDEPCWIIVKMVILKMFQCHFHAQHC
jgi:hypothetical protein